MPRLALICMPHPGQLNPKSKPLGKAGVGGSMAPLEESVVVPWRKMSW